MKIDIVTRKPLRGEKMNILLLIPARTGSKGIPDKNFVSMCGRALWFHTFQQAVAVEQYINASGQAELMTAITTDDCGRFPESVSGYMIDRPNEYATDESPIIDSIRHAVDHVEAVRKTHIDAVCLLQVTSPNRTAEDIVACIGLFLEREGKHGVVSGYLMRLKEKGKSDTKKAIKLFQRNGAVFVIPRELIDEGAILDGEEYEVEMPKSRSVDIDTPDDWETAEAIMEYRLRRGER